MITNTLQLVNRLSMPEIAAYTVTGGIIAYAYREPGAHLLTEFASDGGHGRRTIGPDTTPGKAAEAARAMIETPPAA